MIEFICPGCTKSYEANKAFVGFETRCLRCGTVLRIPVKSGTTPALVASNGQSTEAKPSARRSDPTVRRQAPKPSPRPAAVREEPVEFDIDLGPATRGAATAAPPTPSEPPAPPRRRAVRAESVPSEPPASPEPSAETPLEPYPLALAERKRKKKQRIIGGSIAGGVLLIVLLIVAFSGGKKPVPAPPPPSQAKPEEQKVEPPKPAPPPPKVYERAPMPRAKRPAVEYELSAAALLLEYGEGPPACDQKYAGKDLLIHGIFQQYKFGKLTMVATEEKSTPITFSMLPPADPAPGELMLDPGFKPGQMLAIRGTYNIGCRFTEATVEPAESRPDQAFLGKPIWIENATIRSVNAPTGSVPFPTIVLEPPVTDSKIIVTCYFKVSELDEVMHLKPGAVVGVRGVCAGRNYNAVRIDNCAIVSTDNPPGPETDRVTSDAFFLEYEADLHPFTRVNLKNPAVELLPVTAEGLGHSYQINPRAANDTFRNKAVQLSGTVKERHANTRMIVLQCGTESAYSISVVFSQANFAMVPEADKAIVVKGICSGLIPGGYIRVDSAEYNEIEKGDAARRTDVEFLPYRLGKIHVVDMIAPGRGKDSPLTRMNVHFAGDGDAIAVSVFKVGTFQGITMIKDPIPEPKWATYQPAKRPPLVRRYRIRDGVVEIAQPFPGPGGFMQEFWEPVLKAGLKRGQSWSTRFPDGKMATYTVMKIQTDTATGQERLEIKRTLRDLAAPMRWEETGITYVRGIGEVRRVVTARTELGEVVVTAESRLVSDGSPPPPKTPELKGQPSEVKGPAISKPAEKP